MLAQDQSLILAAINVLPNDDASWEVFNRVGMAIWAATGGSEAGREAFEEFSAKSTKHDPRKTDQRWRHYHRSPPNKIGAGSIMHWANAACPGWLNAYDYRLEAAMAERNARAAADIHSYIEDFYGPQDAGDTASPEANAEPDDASTETDNDDPEPEPEPQSGPKAKPSPEPEARLKAVPFTWRDPKTIPMRDPVYGHFHREQVSAIVANSGLGKTSMIVASSCGMISGKPLLGVQPKRRLKVWHMDLEDPAEELERKYAAAKIHYKLTGDDCGTKGEEQDPQLFTDMKDRRLFTHIGLDQPFAIVKNTTRGASIVVPVVVDSIISEIKRLNIDVVIIDPFISSHAVDENDNNAIDRVVKTWKRIAKEGNCAVILVHHIRKGETEVTTESARGAKSFSDGCRYVGVLNRMTKEEGAKACIENHRSYFRSFSDKANLAPPLEHSDWFKLESVALDNGPEGGDRVGVVVAWKWPERLPV